MHCDDVLVVLLVVLLMHWCSGTIANAEAHPDLTLQVHGDGLEHHHRDAPPSHPGGVQFSLGEGGIFSTAVPLDLLATLAPAFAGASPPKGDDQWALQIVLDTDPAAMPHDDQPPRRLSGECVRDVGLRDTAITVCVASGQMDIASVHVDVSDGRNGTLVASTKVHDDYEWHRIAKWVSLVAVPPGMFDGDASITNALATLARVTDDGIGIFCTCGAVRDTRVRGELRVEAAGLSFESAAKLFLATPIAKRMRYDDSDTTLWTSIDASNPATDAFADVKASVVDNRSMDNLCVARPASVPHHEPTRLMLVSIDDAMADSDGMRGHVLGFDTDADGAALGSRMRFLNSHAEAAAGSLLVLLHHMSGGLLHAGGKGTPLSLGFTGRASAAAEALANVAWHLNDGLFEVLMFVPFYLVYRVTGAWPTPPTFLNTVVVLFIVLVFLMRLLLERGEAEARRCNAGADVHKERAVRNNDRAYDADTDERACGSVTPPPPPPKEAVRHAMRMPRVQRDEHEDWDETDLAPRPVSGSDARFLAMTPEQLEDAGERTRAGRSLSSSPSDSGSLSLSSDTP